MKKYLLWAAIPVILGGAYLVYRSKGASVADVTSSEVTSPAKANYSLVSEKSWAGKKDLLAEDSGYQAGHAVPEAAQTATIPEGAQAADAKIQTFITQSGMGKKLLSMNSMLEQQIEMLVNDQSMKEDDRADVMRVFKKNFDGEKLLAEYTQKIKENFSEADLEKLNTIYSDPQVVRFNQLNSEMSDPSNIKEFQEDFLGFMKNIDQNVSPERKKLVEKIDAAMDVSGQATGLTMEMFSVLSASGSENNEFEQEAKNEFQKSMKDQVQKGLMFTLKDYADQDAQELLQALDPRLMRQVNAITVDVLTPPLRSTLNSLLKNSKDPKAENEPGA